MKNNNVTSIRTASRGWASRLSLIGAPGLILLARGAEAQDAYGRGAARISIREHSYLFDQAIVLEPTANRTVLQPVNAELALLPGRVYLLEVESDVAASCGVIYGPLPQAIGVVSRLELELTFGGPVSWWACSLPNSPDTKLAAKIGSPSFYSYEDHCWPGTGSVEDCRSNSSQYVDGTASASVDWSATNAGDTWRLSELARADSLQTRGFYYDDLTASTNSRTLRRFQVAEPMTLRISGSILIGERGSSQELPDLPDPQGCSGGGGGGGGTLLPFRGRRRGRWYDPPLAHGYRFEATGLANFTKILAFPEGIDGDGLFRVRAEGLDLGSFAVGDSVDFAALTGGPVREFEVTDIGPLVDSGDPTAFPIQLDFDQELVDFDMEPLFTSARATPRNAGANPSSFTCTLPVLGETWQASVDLATTGHPYAWINGYLRPATIPLRGGQVLLGKDRNVLPAGGGVPLGVVRLGPAAGPNAVLSLNLPLDPSLVGTELITQATHFGGGRPFALSNAQDLVLGF